MRDSIIFDLDGTLWDSTEIVAKAWNKVIAENSNLDLVLTSADLKKLFGRPLPDIAGAVFPTLSEQEQLDLIHLCCEAEHLALEQTPGTLFPYLKEVLDELSKSYKLFIVSNCQAGYIEMFLRVTKLSHYFLDFECPGNSGLLKGENNLLIIERNNLSAPIYVGDTQGDADAAAYAKIPFVFAAYGFGSVSEFDFQIHSLPELLELF